MSTLVEVSEVIDRPLEDVFRLLATEHVQNHPRWDPDIRLENLIGGPMRVGTILKRVNTRSGAPVEGAMEVIGFEHNKMMHMLIKEGDQQMDARATYASLAPDRTKYDLKIEFIGFENTVDPSALSHLIQEAAKNHKRFVESHR